MCDLITRKQVIAEVVDVERNEKNGDKYSYLKISGRISYLKDIQPYRIEKLKVRHNNPDFELFEGQHVVVINRAHCRAEWHIETSSHGEVVNATERERRAQAKERSGWDDSREQELCFQKIKQAYDTEELLGDYNLDDAITCKQYKVEYDQKYRVSKKLRRR